MRLPVRRFLNMVHYMALEAMAGDKEAITKFEQALKGGVRTDGRPSWFSDDEEAAQSSIAAARALGLPV